MWWREPRLSRRQAGRLCIGLAAASVLGGCFQPLYGARLTADSESVRDKFMQIDVPVIVAPKGQDVSRLAVSMRNTLNYEFNGGAGPNAPIYTLKVQVSTGVMTIIVDVSSGRPDTQVDQVGATFQLVETATGKVVVSDVASAHVDYDIPGSEQRYAGLRAMYNAEERAVQVAAEAIRNRLASYFVAGT
jgi:LPS-assembly lipoprotein